MGFAALRLAHPDGPLLDNLHVAPEACGEGIGHALFQAVMIRLRVGGFDHLWLEVMDQNHAARAFYQRHGGIEGACFDQVFFGEIVPSRKVAWNPLPEA